MSTLNHKTRFTGGMSHDFFGISKMIECKFIQEDSNFEAFRLLDIVLIFAMDHSTVESFDQLVPRLGPFNYK